MMRWRRRIRTALNEMAEEIDFFDELRRVRRADPFVPFVIVMTSGARYKVTDPESFATGPTMFCVLPPKVRPLLLSAVSDPFH